MSICGDPGVTYLQDQGLNVIRHPEENIRPLMLLGIYRNSRNIIGTLNQIFEKTDIALPIIHESDAAEINSQRTGKLSLDIGLGVLGAIANAAGAEINLNASFEQAHTMRLHFNNVTKSRVNFMDIGDILQSNPIFWDHIILDRYLSGGGKLYIITEVAYSNAVVVDSFRKSGGVLSLEVPELSQGLQGDLKVERNQGTETRLRFSGEKRLAFGFAAIQIFKKDTSNGSQLGFKPVDDGTVYKSADGGETYASYSTETVLDHLSATAPESLLDDPDTAQSTHE